MSPRLVSVIIPAYNAIDLIDEQLQALADQDYSGDFEVIVSDNGSTDGLADHLRDHRLTERLRLRRVDSSGVQGRSHACNVGAAQSEGAFLAICDADDRAHPGWLTALTAAAQQFDAVGGPVETATLNTPLVASWRSFPQAEERFDDSNFLPYAIGCNFGIWREAFEKIGGYDESFTAGGEDLVISWRLQLAGFTLGHTPDAVMAYRLRPTLRATCKQMRSYGAAGPMLYQAFRDHGMPTTKKRNLALIFLSLLLLNPLTPRRLTPVPRGMWFAQTSFRLGRIRGSIRHRTFFL
ncbi:glycosyltransferase [Speluncibacter jeojiensis]|uniref:Glycosyltransferase n=1 Tax=Speluncibacter jeojiensis TaxID=2710754 RepID=A0A9X4RE75_9ACTN|nr:glycosyltransferase [Corynebacteriales bacterium D3-21]